MAITVVILTFLSGRLAIDDPLPTESSGSPQDPPYATPDNVRPASSVTKKAPPAPFDSPPDQSKVSPSSASLVPVEKEDPVQCLVYGRITIDPADPVPNHGFSVVARDEVGSGPYTKTDSEGRYSMSGIRPGTWFMTGHGSGYAEQIEIVSFTLDDPIIQKNFHLTPLPGVDIKLLSPDGKPFYESLGSQDISFHRALSLVPVATKASPDVFIEGIRGSHNNSFGVGQFRSNWQLAKKKPPGYLGRVFLNESPPVFMSLVNFQHVLETQLVEPGTNEITFILSPEKLMEQLGNVKIQFVELESGAPLKGVRAWLQNGGIGGGSANSSDDEGAVTLAPIAPGNYFLHGDLDGYGLSITPLLVQPGTVTSMETILLEKAVGIGGSVLRSGGDPLQTEVKAYLIDPVKSTISHSMSKTVQSGADGSFLFERLTRGRWALCAWSQQEEWVSPRSIIDTSGGSITNVTLTAQPPHSIVVIPPLDRWRKLRFTISAQQGIEPSRIPFYSATPFPRSVPSGTYLVQVLAEDDTVIREWRVTTSEKPLVLRVE